MNDYYIVAYKLYVPDRFDYIKVIFVNSDPQRVIFKESEWAGLTPHIVFIEPAKKINGDIIDPNEFYDYLKKKGYSELASGKDNTGWFLCEEDDIIKAYNCFVEQIKNRQKTPV